MVTRQMEAEVIAMTAAMLHGGPGTSAPDVCGAMTSGALLVVLHMPRAAVEREMKAAHVAKQLHYCSAGGESMLRRLAHLVQQAARDHMAEQTSTYHMAEQTST
jgi:hypothetical protein